MENCIDPGTFSAGDWGTWERIDHSTRKRKKGGSEVGSQVIRLGWFHSHKKTAIGKADG